ncbi:MAG: lysine--tRNA ligase [Deltaproteobacteria bacterium]|nr:lysine--tRNA ligase [Deltaproteobacteria bacterium]
MTDTKETPNEPAQPQQATSEQTLRAARIAKAEKIRARGEDPFTNDIDPSAITDLETLRVHYVSARGEDDKYDPQKVQALNASAPWADQVTVVGRVVAARSFGKAGFLRLRDRVGDVQLFCRKDCLGEAFSRLEEIDVADHVQVSGRVMVTKTGELSVEATSLRLLTKAFLPLPEKWHGLTDVEVRYRRRYVDLISNPDVRSIFKARAFIVRSLRSFLDELGFIEVETPTMTTLVGGATARPFTTHHNALDLDLYMRVAPELYLKRLVVGGLERVYELGRAYRNEGVSTRHNPEFTMLEFYRAYATYDTLMDMTEQMLRHTDAELRRQMPSEHAQWVEKRSFRLDQPFVRKTMIGLLEMRLDPEVDQALEQDARSLADKMRAAGVTAAALKDPELLKQAFDKGRSEPSVGLDATTRKQMAMSDSHGERVFLLYELLVEPNLPRLFQQDGKSIPVFVTDHPVDVSPLARRQTRAGGDSSLVDRFELFVHGKELCNAFSELNDPEDQAERFRQQVAKKARGAEETMDYDEDYIRALEHGLPPTAGFGMGIDRLTMMLTAQDSIREVILFPLLRPER